MNFLMIVSNSFLNHLYFWHPVHLMAMSSIDEVDRCEQLCLLFVLKPDSSLYFFVLLIWGLLSIHHLLVLCAFMLSLFIDLLSCLFCWVFEVLTKVSFQKGYSRSLSLKNGLIPLTFQNWPELFKLGSWSLTIPEDNLHTMAKVRKD